MIKPLTIINALRNSDEYIEDIYLHGGCYQFYLFLKAIFPEAKPYMSTKKTHVYTKIGGIMYDILGEVENWEENYIEPLDIEKNPEVKEWSFNKHNSLQLKECPYCEEPLIYI